MAKVNNKMATLEQKRALIYCRVSTKQQSAEDKFSLATQQAECERYAQERNYQVVEVVREVHSAADLWNRPLLSIVRECLRRGEFEVIIFHQQDRPQVRVRILDRQVIAEVPGFLSEEQEPEQMPERRVFAGRTSPSS